MAYLDPYMQSLQDYIMQGDYGSVIRLLSQNRANDQTGNPMGYAADYNSQLGSRSGLLGTIYEVLTGINPKAFEGNTNVDQFQNLFRSYVGGGGENTATPANYQRQALQQMFSNSEGARDYYSSMFDGSNGTAGSNESVFQKIASQIAALLSNRYSSTALKSMFGGSALNRLVDEYRMKNSADPTYDFMDHLYSIYGKYLPPIDRMKDPAPDKNNPSVTNRNPIDKPAPTSRPDDTFPRPGPTRPREEPFKPGPRKVGGFLGAM